MFKFIKSKILNALGILAGVVGLIFILFNCLPGDPARMMLGQRNDAETLKAINHELGRDRPLPVQFLLYVNDLSPVSLHSNNEDGFAFPQKGKYSGIQLFSSQKINLMLKIPYLGRSYVSHKKVSDIIFETLPQTAVLAIISMTFATLAGIAMGGIAAAYKGKWPDQLLLFLTALGVAGPSFFMAILVAWLFGFHWSACTGLPMTGSLFETDPFGDGQFLRLSNLILPAFTLGIRPLSVVLQLSRNSFLEVLSQDYIRTAKAKGLSSYQIFSGHVLRNSLNPVITAISGWLAGMLAGAIFIEYIFGWKGIGREMVSALENYDFPVITGCVLVIAILFIILNILTDLLYGIVDPRIRFS